MSTSDIRLLILNSVNLNPGRWGMNTLATEHNLTYSECSRVLSVMQSEGYLLCCARKYYITEKGFESLKGRLSEKASSTEQS